MAIALDAQSNGAASNTTSVSWSHTCTGTNLALIVGIWSQSGDAVTSVTYNSVAMTQAVKLAMTGSAAGQYIYLYYLLNPATGTNTVAATSSGVGIDGASTSYTGVKQSGQPDATGTNVSTATTSLTTSLTTIADNCWLVGFAYTGSTQTAGTNTTLRGSPVAGILCMIDSNSAQTPAGSKSMNVTQASNFAGMVMASISPFTTQTSGAMAFFL